MAKPLAAAGALDDVDPDELPKLTPVEMIFVENYIGGATAADSYRAAKPDSQAADSTTWAIATKFKNNPSIKAWVSAAKVAGAMRAACTVESHLIELDRLKEIAIKNKNIGAAVRAEELRAKAAGIYVMKDPNLRTRDNDLAAINEAVGMFGVAMASTMAKELGYHPSEIPALAALLEKQIDGVVERSE